MPDIQKINAVAIADIEKLDAVTAANIEKVNGLTFFQAPDARFIFVINTALGDGTAAFHIPLSGTVNFTVDWGDGNSNTITSDTDPNMDHTYASGGTYDIILDGTLGQWNTGTITDRTKITDVKNWGAYPGRTMTSHSNLSTDTASDNPDWANFVLVQNSAQDFFFNCTNFNGDITNWNMTGVGAIRRMFRNTLFNQDISGWDVSSVVDMQDCFRGSSAFNQNINAWTTTSLTSLRYTFLANTVYDQPLANWDTSSVLTMEQTFNGATSFNQDLGGWNISSVGNCSGMISNTALSTANYDSLLIGWAAQAPSIQTGVTLSVGPQYSSAAVSARNVLTSTYSWTITDGGLI